MLLKLKLFAVCALLVAAALATAGEVKWGSSYDAALKQAKKTHHLVMVDFYADW
jgi:thiol:disulfide interchange protein